MKTVRDATLAVCAIWLVAIGLSSLESAKPARLIGSCHGQILAAMEEDDFPAGCSWIEPIRYN